jgi:hypothetical protein
MQVPAYSITSLVLGYRGHPHGEKALFKASIAEWFSAIHSQPGNLTSVKSLFFHPVFPVVK